MDTPLDKDSEGDAATIGDKIEDNSSFNPMQETEAVNNSEVILKFLNKLTQRERDIIARRFGLGGGGSETLDNIGDSYKLTRERIRQIEYDALKKLKVMINKAYDNHI